MIRALAIFVGAAFMAFGTTIVLGFLPDDIGLNRFGAYGAVCMGFLFVAFGIFGRTGIDFLDHDV